MSDNNDEEPRTSTERRGSKWRASQILTHANGKATQPMSPAAVIDTWPENFALAEESPDRPGLRTPQVGAIHALLGYWTTDPRVPATIVMPTGTGKTDTMVTAMVATRIERLLVVVPSDALRDQLAAKFASLGVLPTLDLVPESAAMPVVGKLFGRLDDIADADALADICNVVISTPNALTNTSDEVRSAFLSRFTHLFIDEAHHVSARTWRTIRDGFAPKPVVQFTATPHRSDGQHLGGSLIYAFPLREAQRQGYFSKIRFASVLELVNPDVAVAKRAIAALRADLEAGLDHLVMARANTVIRAQAVLAIYEAEAADLGPVLVHSGTKKADTESALTSLASRESRILVCVDMFGEGFDLPQLKIAAMHDQHRSLGITLQFVGRFARSGGATMGSATVVAARSEVRHNDALRRLYAEDADWNLIIEDLTARAVEEQQEIDEFTKAFGSLPDAISIHSITPALSTVVYKPTTLTWHPQGASEFVPPDRLITYPIPTNERDHVLWYVTASRSEPRWGMVDNVDAIEYDLFIVYWDEKHGLLYIHSSDNSSVHEKLAAAVTGQHGIAPLSGEEVFRVFHEVQRLTPNNVGLLDTRNRSRRYTSHHGSDVTEAFPAVEAQTKTQTHIAGTGFLNGAQYSIAASLKGRVWSHRTANGLKQWTEWCDVVGPKIIDPAISVDEIMSGFIRPVTLGAWPADRIVLDLELSTALGDVLEPADVTVDGVSVQFADVSLVVGERTAPSDLSFTVQSPLWRVQYLMRLTASGLTVHAADPAQEVGIVRTRKTQPFSELANRFGIRVLLDKDAVIEPPGLLLQPSREVPPFEASRLTPLDWSGVNIRKESWGEGRDPNTVQGRVMARVLEGTWDVVLDDDGSGEVADIVALREVDGTLVVQLTHCKFSSENQPGARLADLYELSGQAQRSAGWRRNTERMLQRLIRRERTRAASNRTGFVHGTIDDLQRLYERSEALRPRLDIVMAQPGLSKKHVKDNQLELLGSVDMYVAETALSVVTVLCSE